MINRNPIRYIDRHRAKMRLLRKRELEKARGERNIKKIKIALRRENEQTGK